MRMGLGLGIDAGGGRLAAPLGGVAGASVVLLADTGITLNGSDVSAWADQSAGGTFDVAQGTAADQPGYLADAGDGAPAIDFDGTESLPGAGVPFGASAADYSFCCLIKADADTGAFSVGPGLAGIKLRVHPTFYDHLLITDAVGVGEAIRSLTGGWHFAAGRRSGASLKLKVDALAEITVAAPGGAITMTSWVIGSVFGLAQFDGQLRSLIGYQRHISDAEVAAARTWHQARFPGVP